MFYLSSFLCHIYTHTYTNGTRTNGLDEADNMMVAAHAFTMQHYKIKLNIAYPFLKIINTNKLCVCVYLVYVQFRLHIYFNKIVFFLYYLNILFFL